MRNKEDSHDYEDDNEFYGLDEDEEKDGNRNGSRNYVGGQSNVRVSQQKLTNHADAHESPNRNQLEEVRSSNPKLHEESREKRPPAEQFLKEVPSTSSLRDSKAGIALPKETMSSPGQKRTKGKEEHQGIVVNKSTIDRLVQINDNLKEELQGLTDRLDEVLKNQVANQKIKEEDTNEELQSKEHDLFGAQYKAAKIQKEVQVLKRKMETAVDYEMIVKLENELQWRSKGVRALADQVNMVKKVRSEHSKAISELNRDGDIDERLKTVKEQVRDQKKENKDMEKKIKEMERDEQEHHKAIVDKQERIRMLSKALKQRQRAQMQEVSSRK